MCKTKKIILSILGLVLLSNLVSFTDAAKLFFSPATGTFTYNCPFTVDVMVDMEGQDSTAMDLKIMANDAKFGIMDFDGQGGLFSTYTKPKNMLIRRGNYRGINTMYVFFSTFAPPKGIQGVGKLGTLTIKPYPGFWEVPLNFYFQSGDATEDSNIPYFLGNKVVDGLTSVENGYYTLKEGPCIFSGSSDYQLQEGGSFELVKNEKMNQPHESSVIVASLTQFAESTFFKQYGRYIILLIVLLALFLIWIGNRKKKEE